MTVKYKVCTRCEGSGFVSKLGAFSREWVDENYGPDAEEFMAEYMKRGGIYDEHCPECKGERVVAPLTPEQQAEAEADAEYEAERQAEIRMGC